MDISTKKTRGRILLKDKTYTVKDVITRKCMQFLDVAVEEEKNCKVIYECFQCMKIHILKKEGSRYIYCPEIWFVKPEKDTRYKRLKRKVKKRFSKKDLGEHLILIPTEKPEEVPTRRIRRRKNKEIESDGG